MVKQLKLGANVRAKLVEMSKGHPYIIQLQGFYLFQHFVAGEQGAGRNKKYEVTEDDCECIFPLVKSTYCARALEPILKNLSSGEVNYLRAMANVLDEDRRAQSGEIAEWMDCKTSALSVARQKLIDAGIIFSPSRGQVAFMIPYLADYLVEAQEVTPDAEAVALEWGM